MRRYWPLRLRHASRSLAIPLLIPDERAPSRAWTQLLCLVSTTLAKVVLENYVIARPLLAADAPVDDVRSLRRCHVRLKRRVSVFAAEVAVRAEPVSCNGFPLLVLASILAFTLLPGLVPRHDDGRWTWMTLTMKKVEETVARGSRSSESGGLVVSASQDARSWKTWNCSRKFAGQMMPSVAFLSDKSASAFRSRADMHSSHHSARR